MNLQGKYIDFANRLEKVYKRLSKIAAKKGISCYRLYDLDLPEFPFLLDVYEKRLYVSEYERKHNLSDGDYEEWLQLSMQIMSETLAIRPESIFIRKRKSVKERTDQYIREGNDAKEYYVKENGLAFLVNLSDFLDTGLFLDHRPTRKMILESSSNKRVLNLFAYTGSFSVYAAAGGASEVTTVDLSKTYIDWARRNMELNGFVDKEKYKYHQEDVLQFWRKLPREYYDIIVLDPPTFSNSKRMDGVLDTQRDHVQMINFCLMLLKKGGCIYFSTNYTKFKLHELEINPSKIKDITARTTDFDFEKRLHRKCYYIVKD